MRSVNGAAGPVNGGHSVNTLGRRSTEVRSVNGAAGPVNGEDPVNALHGPLTGQAQST